MLSILAVALVSCNKDDGEELSGDDIIQFKDPNFLKILLLEQEIEIYDATTDNYIPYMMDVDKNKDGQISVDEAKSVKGLALRDYNIEVSYNIEDISEISYFTSLEYLECPYQSVQVVDLSANKKLTEIFFEGSKLISLNLNGCSALENVCVDETDCLKNLNIKGCSALTHLSCVYGLLSSIDVSDNVNLTELSCSDNPLETLTISESQRNASWLDDVKAEYPDIEIIVK